MLTPDQLQIDKIYDHLADEINISDAMAEKAINSYQAVGRWLGDCEPQLGVAIMPQGSFYLGTVIKPISDADEYDIDLVCLLKKGHGLGENIIKNIVGNRLKEHGRYKEMLQPEGKRCWTLQYDAFHMDILPCVPKSVVFMKPILTEIRLTHKKAPSVYEPRYSNPEGYHEWFEDQMRIVLSEQRRFMADKQRVDISAIPTRATRTPLQKAIQLLKRHRDIKYATNENAPISIIITTLAALSYNNEPTTYEALSAVLNDMESHIECRNGVYWIANPAMPEENFADKWATVPQKRQVFMSWLAAAKKDILQAPLEARGLDEVSASMSSSFGKNMTNRAINKLGLNARAARDVGGLFVEGLRGGVTESKTATSNKIGGHTFFGKK